MKSVFPPLWQFRHCLMLEAPFGAHALDKMLDRERLKKTVGDNRIIIILFHVLIAIKVTSRFTTLNLPGWELAVSWTSLILPFAATLMTGWLAYYYIYRAGERLG